MRLRNKGATSTTKPLSPSRPGYDTAIARRPSLGARLGAFLENEAVFGYALMVPALALIVIFIAYPFGLGIWMALTDKLVGKAGSFVGLRNFTRLFQSEIFWQTAWNTVFFTVTATALKAILGMWLAVLLNRRFRFSRVTRATVLLPFIVPTVLSGLAWLWMFDATFSVFNWILRWMWQMELHVFGIVLKENWGYFKGPLWLGEPRWAMASIIIVNTWRGIPFFAITLLAGLQTVPQELYDAGDIDGATRLQAMTRIVLPLGTPGILSAGIFSFTLSWNEFLYALVFISSPQQKTIPVGVVSELIKGDVFFWGALMAGALFGSIPVAFVYSFFVENYVSGMTGAVKG